MTYEWDVGKRTTNLAKHGVDFATVARFDFDNAVTRTVERDGEIRYVATSYIGARLYRLIYAERGNNIRVISLRKANNRERRDYERSR